MMGKEKNEREINRINDIPGGLGWSLVDYLTCVNRERAREDVSVVSACVDVASSTRVPYTLLNLLPRKSRYFLVLLFTKCVVFVC
jgi:hypothetical protein